MIKKYCLPFLTLFFSASIAATAQNTVEGKVTDSTSKPVAYANVILLNAADSTTVYKGAVSGENGNFSLNEIAADSYLLKVSFVGYEDFLKQVKISEDRNLGQITLKEATTGLDEVSINYKNPSVERKVDRLVFKVENTTLSSGTSWDILKKTPGVIMANNVLQVRNQGVDVYINDRKVQLSAAELQTLLSNYSAENIKSVEVITNPPARYDAEGGAILNIVTTSAISPGYKGSVNAAWTQAIFPKYTFGTSHYQKGEKINLFANYSFSPRKEFKNDISYINFRDNSGIISRWETDFERTTRSKAHNANLMLDYYLDERNTLSFSANGLYSPNKTFDNEVLTEIDDRQGEDSSFYTNSGLETDQANIGMDLEFTHKLKKPGAQLSAKAHYTHYEQNRDQNVFTRYFDASGVPTNDNRFFTDADQEINIVTGQLDYSTPWGTTNFATGVKASMIDSESGIDFYDVANGDDQYNQALSDNFLYDEGIYAAYFSLAKDWDSWSVKGGLRGEFTDRQGESISMDEVDSREYFELFPTFYLMHTFSPKHSMSFDYSRRIQRPRYESLNPFRYFLNEHNYNAGNPDLRAAISNNFNLNYTFKNEYFFDIYYRDNGPAPATLSFQDNQARNIRSVSVNLLESSSYGLDISHGRSITNWWYAYAYTSFFHEEQTFLALESGNAEVTNELDGFYGTLYNSLVISKDGTFTGELTFTYVSDWLSGSYYLEPMTTLSVGLRKTLWNNRAELTLNVEDALDETNTWMRSRYLNQDNGFFAEPETRYVRIGFKYNFGNFRLSDNQRAVEAAERERL
ncbi:Outer membrane receptor proteins, mostly Fe transport [Salinimicrobium catena]|uniref:Outer membrane receptor proteins, mostly Fe transport n=1 Tax=Salinimicrobium catena TaxID=390640 RepID=A0A1H5IN16_9FLAO|nr:outer membrane beta-barrel family protein [Salinimicrobium catena]SDK78992.1 Outer membrane receptor proteins, mostly Fe transport [Salinimicrobium catena]SEE41565.1 Outer membrane receptor proteins, mostly Fe transport [Salinimicrobium catena]